MADRNYPLPVADDDPRLTFGLMLDIADVLKAAGYPPLTGFDLAALQQDLFRFLYTNEEGSRG
jgi:hypothetical protein